MCVKCASLKVKSHSMELYGGELLIFIVITLKLYGTEGRTMKRNHVKLSLELCIEMTLLVLR